MIVNDQFTLSIALLQFVVDARDSEIKLTVPPIFNKFLVETNFSEQPELEGLETLQLRVAHEPRAIEEIRRNSLCRTLIWELWIDENGDFVFVSPRQSPPKRVTIGKAFQQGVINFDFSLLQGREIYPLESIDIRIAVNWLANFGDLILHASGVAVGSQGYCFIGTSGAGKSTLTKNLADQGELTILGEDQIILRYLSGQFWIFGTPWHEHDNRCSPIGVPLRKVFFLDRHQTPGIKAYPAAEGITKILQTAFVPYYLPDKLPRIMDQLNLLAVQIPFYQLSYQLGTTVLPTIIKQAI